MPVEGIQTDDHQPHNNIELSIDVDASSSIVNISDSQNNRISMVVKAVIFPVITKCHAGYFRISLSLCCQTLLWKTLADPPENAHAYRRMLGMLPYKAFILLWSLSLFTLVFLSFLYILRCILMSSMVKNEYLNHIGVNYFFAPWISWLLLLQSSPVFTPNTIYYVFLWWVFVVPIFILDVKIYGQWFTKGKQFLSAVANPATQLSVIGNLVGARAAAQMGWRESAVIMFSLGMVHYLVLFVTLYQRLPGNSFLPDMLRPILFLFFAAPSMASLAWDSITGTFDSSSKMLFFLSLFLFLALVCRPKLFKKSMKKFNVVWWAYSFPITALALASTEYAQEVKGSIAHLLMLFLSMLSVLVSLVLLLYTALNPHMFLPSDEDDDDDHDNNTNNGNNNNNDENTDDDNINSTLSSISRTASSTSCDSATAP